MITKERIAELRLNVPECGTLLEEIERLEGELKTIQETPLGVAVTQCRRLGTELATVKESREVLIAREQDCRVECNRLRELCSRLSEREKV